MPSQFHPSVAPANNNKRKSALLGQCFKKGKKEPAILNGQKHRIVRLKEY